LEDFKLWGNIKKGDAKSLNKLHALYFRQMCLFAKKTVHDNQLVESIVSNCFIKIWENRKKVEIKTSVKSYLYQILRNQITDHYRGKQEKAELPGELPDIPNEIEFDEQERYIKLYKAISKLPEQRKNILELAVFDSLTYQQIADKLNISKNTVKTQMARAYRFLKESLEPRDFYFFCLLQKKL
jgi:RNA polymerase sigma-70 factor (ECF subfamily)